MDVIEASNSPLHVEPLKARHISMLTSLKPHKRLGWLRLMLLRSWVAELEKNLSNLLPNRNPFCLLALENEKPVSLVIVRPINRRGTCWTLCFIKSILNPKDCSHKEIKNSLLKSILEVGRTKAQSWLVRCPINDKTQLAIIREYGFQPLKVLNYWIPSKSIQGSIIDPSITSWSKDFEWQEINATNANFLLRLEQIGQSSHLRQIIDRQWKDFLEFKNNYSGVLIPKNNKRNDAILGLICRNWGEEELTVEILKDLAWDERLCNIIPEILLQLLSKTSQVFIETSQDDEKLTALLENNGWELNHEKILLVRSLWRRQESRKLINGNMKLESMLGKLNPQTPPLPTPSIEPR